MTDPTDADATDRRTALRLTAAALAAGLSGCLSNPWEPGADRGDGAGPATSDEAEGEPNSSTEPTDENETGGEAVESAEESGEDAGESGDDSPPEPDLVVEVAPDGFQFDPSSFEIGRGDTVRWVWRAGGHNLCVRSQPEDSAWEGTPGSASDTYGEGYEHVHTFEAAGDYEYFCAPHQTLGLEGSFTVR